MSLPLPQKKEFRDGLDRLSNHTKAFSDLVRIVVEPVAEALAIQEVKSNPHKAAILPEALRIDKYAKEFKSVLTFDSERRRLTDTITNIFEYGPTLLSPGSWQAIHQELKDLYQTMKEKGSHFESMQLSEEFFLSLYTLGKILFERGLFDRASNVFFFLVTFCPNCAQFWSSYGLINQKTRHFNIALNAYTKASDLEPDENSFQFHLADCYADMFNRKEAEEILNRVEKQAEGDMVALLSSIRSKIEVNMKGRG